MAILIKRLGVVWLLLAAALLVGAPGCSLILDSDELRAGADGAVGDGSVSGDADTGAPPDNGPTPDTTADVPPGEPQVLFPGGGSSCVLRYQSKLVTNCIETCPAAGWKLTFDLDGADDATSFSWRFTASTGYKVAPLSAATRRPTVTLTFDGEGVDLCGATGQSVDPASVFVELGIDGATPTSRGKLVATPLVSANCAAASDCPDPPQ